MAKVLALLCDLQPNQADMTKTDLTICVHAIPTGSEDFQAQRVDVIAVLDATNNINTLNNNVESAIITAVTAIPSSTAVTLSSANIRITKFS